MIGWLCGSSDPEHHNRFVHDRVSRLVEYDAEHHTDLLATLSTYFATGRRHTATAQRLHIHANTLYQRLQRVSELAGIDFEDADDVLQAHLALRLHELGAQV